MPSPFNWVCDWFDEVADGNDERALVVVEEDGSSDLPHVRGAARALAGGVGLALRISASQRGDSVIVMLGNRVELWESMLAIMRLGAVVMPTTTAVGPAELVDRIDAGRRPARDRRRRRRRQVRRRPRRLHAGQRGSRAAWGGRRLAHLRRRLRRRRVACRATRGRRPRTACCSTSPPAPPAAPSWSSTPRCPTRSATCRRCSGSGVRPGDVHLNISSRRLGQARLVVLLRAVARRGHDRGPQLRALRPAALLRQLREQDVTTFCAPPTVWRMLIKSDLSGGSGLAARADRRRRAAQPRGDRPGPAALGHDAARRLRPDRDDGRGRQHAGLAGQARLDGPPAARGARRAGRPASPASGSRARARARSASTSRDRSVARCR